MCLTQDAGDVYTFAIVKTKVTSKQRLLELKRDTVLPTVRVTVEEKRRCEKVAEHRHLSLGTLIRQWLLTEADKIEKEKREAA